MKQKLLKTGLLATFAAAPAALAQDCGNNSESRLCGTNDPDSVVVMPVGENTETGSNTRRPTRGFAISVNGQTEAGDPELIDLQRKADVALSQADIQVRFDGLGTERQLNALVVSGGVVRPGESVEFQSRMNYPAFAVRGEIRIMDASAPGGPRLLKVVDVDPGERVTTTLPEGDTLVYAHRVYNAHGRFDETIILPLSYRDDRGTAKEELQEDGSSTLNVQGIPVNGGAVTVSGIGLPPQTRVRTLGEVIQSDDQGRFVIQRILPVGDHAIDIATSTVDITREVEIPGAEWFYVGIVDMTLGWRSNGSQDSSGRDISGYYDRGRIAAYVNGRTASGVQVTASIDSREEELSNIFRNLDRRDPRSLLQRLDADDLYPTYGDDSTIVETAPTSGRYYVRVKKDGNHIMWGNYRANLSGAEYIRNERTLYGLQGHWESRQVTSNGHARLSFDAYVAQPDNLPGRDVFRGTGGSVYFLSKQDISIGSETITVEIRDPQSGRVIDRKTLVSGTDYDINYIQGTIRLRHPLSAYAGNGELINNNPNGDNAVNLVAQYEWTPTGLDVDGHAFGGRGETWLTDQIRIGLTGQVEKTETADQIATGVDLRWQKSDRTFAEAEYAYSDGPGFGTVVSTDGGLTGTETPVLSGRGQAYRFKFQGDLQEIGLPTPGLIGGYFERREAGFTSLDYSVASDETLWGVFGEVEASERTELKFHADFYENDAGRKDNKTGVEADYTLSPAAVLSFGFEYLDRTTPGNVNDTGRRTDVALRYQRAQSEQLSWYVFGQATVDRSGGLSRNNRIGIGVDAAIDDHWRLKGEVSDGDQGVGARALLSYDDNKGSSSYFGYTLDPDRSLVNTTLSGRDRGQFVVGGTKRVSDRLTSFAENTYDMFGRRKSLTGTYGVDYVHSEYSDYSLALEVGTVEDPVDGDFRRHALSIGYAFDNEITTASARLEYRRERGETGVTNRNSDTIIFAGDLSYKISEQARFLGSVDLVHTDADSPTLTNTEFAEFSLGYAFRPIHHDKLNVLARYRFIHDEYGQLIGSSFGTDVRGPLQHSHILSLDAEYDLSPQWSLGSKLGYRWSETAPAGTDNFASNNAWLAVANARYHVTHNWDALAELRVLGAEQAATTDYGLLLAGYRHFGNNLKAGIGYNFGSFSDDLADLTFDERGVFLNVVAKF